LGAYVTLNHDTISGNTASNQGGGLYNVQASSVADISNTIFYGNADSSGTGEPAQIRRAAGTVTLNYSLVQGLTGLLGGSGNVSGNPNFADANGADNIYGTLDDDVHLASFSAAIDAGSNAVAAADDFVLAGEPTTTEALPLDYDGGQRFRNDGSVADTGVGPAPVIDIGAY